MNYTICSGFHAGGKSEEFFRLWHDNVIADLSGCEQIVVLADSGAEMPYYSEIKTIDWLTLSGNLGHIGDVIHGRKPSRKFVGWSTTVMALALLCYQNETDMVYQEQDCLTFGDCIGEMYQQIDAGKVIFGKSKLMTCAQSLFLVKHDYLPDFVADYMSIGPDTNSSCLTEDHFKLMKDKKPDVWKQFNFGVDRERPEGWIDQRPMYVQQLTEDELKTMKDLQMI